MVEIAWVSPTGTIFHLEQKGIYSRKIILQNAEELIKTYYPKEWLENNFDWADDFLLHKGWAHIVELRLIEAGVYVTFRDNLSDEAFAAIDDFIKENYTDQELSKKFKTDWAYEAAFHPSRI